MAAEYRLVEPITPSIVDYSGGEPRAAFEEVFLLVSHDGPRDVETLTLRLLKQGKRVHIVPGIFDGTLFRQTANDFAGVPVLTIGGHGLDRYQAAAKRAIDIAVSVVLLAGLAPILALVALLVKLSSVGPVLFTHERLGLSGRRFRIYKFRSMYSDAQERLESDRELRRKYVENNYKLPRGQDPRITPLGAFLRASSLDELPQLLNVLKGDMSLVGPRPIVPAEIAKYGDYGPLFLSVKPGLTGYWQIHGRSDIADYARRAALDIEYIRDQSLKTDVDVLLRTIPAVLMRRGAH